MAQGMRLRGGIAGIAAIAMATGSAFAQTTRRDLPNLSAIAPVFSQLVLWRMPGGFHGAYETTHGDSYVMEAVPTGETVEDWSQIVTLTGMKDGSATPALTPEVFAGKLATSFQTSCPDTFSTKRMQPPAVDHYPTFAALISCGSLPASGSMPAHSETTLVVVIQGRHDYYTVQWAERGDPQPRAMKLDDADHWYGHLHALTPIHLCDKVAGEQAPYPSCMASIEGQATPPRTQSPDVEARPSTIATADTDTDTEEHSAATAFVGGLHYFIGRMASACRPILGEPESRPKALVDAWLRQAQNELFFNATAQYMGRILAAEEQRKGESAMRHLLQEALGHIHQSSDAEVQHELAGDDAAREDTCRRFEDNLEAGRFNVTPDTPHYATLLQLVKEMRPTD